MADMPVHGEAGSTEDNILADEALINILILLNFCEFTAITIVIVGHTHLLGDFLVHLLGLLLAQLEQELVALVILLVAAERAGDSGVGADLVLGPLLETAQVKGVLALLLAGRGQLAGHHLLVADRTPALLIVLILFFHDDVGPVQIRRTHEPQEVADFVQSDPPVCDHKPQLRVKVGGLPQQSVGVLDPEYLFQYVQRVFAVVAPPRRTRAPQLVADRDFVLTVLKVLQNEARVASHPHKVQLRHLVQGLQQPPWRIVSVGMQSFAHLSLIILYSIWLPSAENLPSQHPIIYSNQTNVPGFRTLFIQMISLRSMAQKAPRTSMPANPIPDPISLSRAPTYDSFRPISTSPFLSQSYRSPQPQTTTYTPPPAFVQPLTDTRRKQYQPQASTAAEFPAAQLKTQIRDFRNQLWESWFVGLTYALLLVVPLYLLAGLRMVLEGCLLSTLLLYVKIVVPGVRSHWLYYPVILTALVTFYTDFTGFDISIYTFSSFVYCLPAALLMLIFKFKVFGRSEARMFNTVHIGQDEPYGIIGITRLTLQRTLKDLLSGGFIKLIAANLLFSTVIGFVFRVIDFKPQFHLYFLQLLVVCHVAMLFTLNLLNEVDVWTDISEKDVVRLDEEVPLAFWMMRLEDPNYQHQQERSIKHVSRIIHKHKNIMHQELTRRAYSQRNYWDIFTRYANYELGRVDGYLSQLKSTVLRLNQMITLNRPLSADLLVYFRKIYGLVQLSICMREATGTILRTLPTLDVLVKALAYSRSGMERQTLEENFFISSKIKSIAEYTADIFVAEWRTPALTQYLSFCAELLRMLGEGFEADKINKMLQRNAVKLPIIDFKMNTG